MNQDEYTAVAELGVDGDGDTPTDTDTEQLGQQQQTQGQPGRAPQDVKAKEKEEGCLLS